MYIYIYEIYIYIHNEVLDSMIEVRHFRTNEEPFLMGIIGESVHFCFHLLPFLPNTKRTFPEWHDIFSLHLSQIFFYKEKNIKRL